MKVQKLAFDKERFELLCIVQIFSKQETDLIISIVWRSWPPNGGLDEVKGGSPEGSPPPTSSRPRFGGHDLQTMEIIEAVSSFEKIRTMLAQILVYQEHISAKFMCFAKFMEVVEVVEVVPVIT